MAADAGTWTDARAFSRTTIRFDQMETERAFLSYNLSPGGTFFPLKVLDANGWWSEKDDISLIYSSWG